MKTYVSDSFDISRLKDLQNGNSSAISITPIYSSMVCEAIISDRPEFCVSDENLKKISSGLNLNDILRVTDDFILEPGDTLILFDEKADQWYSVDIMWR